MARKGSVLLGGRELKLSSGRRIYFRDARGRFAPSFGTHPKGMDELDRQKTPRPVYARTPWIKGDRYAVYSKTSRLKRSPSRSRSPKF